MTCEPCLRAAREYRSAWNMSRAQQPTARQVRSRAMLLLARRHAEELAWLERRVRAGML